MHRFQDKGCLNSSLAPILIHFISFWDINIGLYACIITMIHDKYYPAIYSMLFAPVDNSYRQVN